MDSTKTPYASFPLDWIVKSTFYPIRYRKAFDINEIDEVFCSIINAKVNEINVSEIGSLLGFNLQDLAEIDILNIYLKGLTEYNLIVINNETIQLTEFGQEALQSKLKYKYFFATTTLFENQQATGEMFDFSFKNVFDLENGVSQENRIEKPIFENSELKQKLQFQIFGNDIYKGEIIELYESSPYINYKSISLQCEITALEDSFQLSIYKSGVNKPDIQFLIELPENAELKRKLVRKGMFHRILSVNNLISRQEIETYIDLWNWKELAENPKIDWSDKIIFELFQKNGDGSVWNVISEKAPIESIKSIIQEYAEYWNWTTITERFDNSFIKDQIEKFNWDFEELSYKETDLVISLLQNSSLKDRDWDWIYLSKNLPDKFIEENIENFNWDFYEITASKNDVFKKIFIKYRDKLEVLISKNWNWKFISEEINLNFLHKNISGLASKLDWHAILNRFFSNEEITAKCLQEESFKSILKQYLPDNFVVAHQKYLWTPNLIDFFEEQNLIQWESKTYINGFDTNENVEWYKIVFQKYHSRITTEKGFLNISQQISDYSLVEEFPNFAWNWEGISQNNKLISNNTFIEKAFVGEFSFSNNLLWDKILSQTTFDVAFWNKNLEVFHNSIGSEKQISFWKLLTKKENRDYIFSNIQFPWDWSFITEDSTKETILNTFEDEDLFGKWDWEIATRKLDKETILDKLEELARFIDWKFLINEVFAIENELAMDNQLPRIAAGLSVVIVDTEKRKDIWKDITVKFPFETLFPLVESTIQFDVFEWDWDFISNHKHFPTDIATLNKYKSKINWTAFSESKAIQQKFNPDSWDNVKQWFNNIDRYLQQFDDYWNWQVLSHNKNINYNRLILQKYKTENWDWNYLSEYGGFLTEQKRDRSNKTYLEEVVRQFPKIKFEFLSKRKDINIDSNLILSTKDKKWDWQILSENEKAEISNELILELKDRNWNWKAISKRKNLTFNNETLLQLLDKDWDWSYLSENPSFEFNTDFIGKTKSKSWNWQSVSRHKSFLPTVEILTLTKDFDLDWEYLSQHSSLIPNKEILAKFETKWNWLSITKNPQINFNDIDFIEHFSDKWNWDFICEEGKLTLNNQILTKFKEHLEWNLISSNTNLNFTKEVIQEFYELWNWSNLKCNKRIEDLKLTEFVINIIEDDPILYFIDRIAVQNSPWKECVFHFTNIDNAVKIIMDGKIKSRKTAEQLSNESGILTHKTRKDPEKFARFYFRTSTPAQFYNEGLGLTPNHPKYNNGYRELGYPKCPIMIYFRISLQEILFKNKELAHTFLSNGNMQRNRTKYGKLKDMISLFHYDELFQNLFDEKNGYYSQQELMFELDVSILNLSSLEVICENEPDKQLLERMLGNDKNKFKIKIDNSIYGSINDRPLIILKDEEVRITSNYNQEGYFMVCFENFVPIIANGDIIKIDDYNKIIYFKSFLIFPITFQDFKIEFFEEIENIKQKWILGTQKDFKFEYETYQRKYF